MSVKRVASRYAKSLLDLAVERGILQEVHQDMQQLLSVISTNRDFALMLKSPILKSDLKAKVIKEVFSKSAQELTMSFFEIVSRKNRADILADVASEFHALYNDHEDIQVAELTTTFEIDDNMRKVFAGAVREISGKSKVNLVEKIDQDIIGGYILRVNDRQLDESMSSKLKALRIQFSTNHYEKQI